MSRRQWFTDRTRAETPRYFRLRVLRVKIGQLVFGIIREELCDSWTARICILAANLHRYASTTRFHPQKPFAQHDHTSTLRACRLRPPQPRFRLHLTAPKVFLLCSRRRTPLPAAI